MGLFDSLLSSLSSNSSSGSKLPECKYYLKYNNDEDRIQLPVPPSAFEMSVKNNNGTVNINNLGELNMLGKTGLITISLSSFFPAQSYHFCQCTPEADPYSYIKKIVTWKDSGQPVRLVITNANINYPVTIDAFKYGEKDGTGNIDFTIDLREYRFIMAEQETTENGLNKRTDENSVTKKTKNITIRPGDSNMDVVSRALGQSIKMDGTTADYLKAYKVLSKKGVGVGDVLKVTGTSSIKIGDYNVQL